MAALWGGEEIVMDGDGDGTAVAGSGYGCGEGGDWVRFWVAGVVCVGSSHCFVRKKGLDIVKMNSAILV